MIAALHGLVYRYRAPGIAYALSWTLDADPGLDDAPTNLGLHILEHPDVSILKDCEHEFPFTDQPQGERDEVSPAASTVVLCPSNGILDAVTTNRADIAVLTVNRVRGKSFATARREPTLDPEAISKVPADLAETPTESPKEKTTMNLAERTALERPCRAVDEHLVNLDDCDQSSYQVGEQVGEEYPDVAVMRAALAAVEAFLAGNPALLLTGMVHVLGAIAEVDDATVPEGVMLDIIDHDDEEV